MALAVASSTTLAWSLSSPVLTKPSGLAVGDLMVAVIGSHAADGTGVDDPSTPAGWTLDISYNRSAPSINSRIHIFSKVAESADVAASDFSFTTTTDADKYWGGYMLRVTGGSGLIDDMGDTVGGFINSGPSGTQTISVTLDTEVTNSLVLQTWLCRDNKTYSNYTISGSNPAWTEIAEIKDTLPGADVGMALASAPLTARRTITDFTTDTTGTTQDYIGVVFYIKEPQAISVNPDSLNMMWNVVSPTTQAGAALLVEPVSMAFSVETPTVTGKKNIWTNGSKNSTSWTNQSKT